MSIVPTWPIAAGALVLGMAGGFWIEHTRLGAKIDQMVADSAEAERQRQLVRADDEREAREKEQRLAQRAGQIEQEKQDAISKIRSDSAAAIARLQQRPDRKPAGASGVPAPAPACAGSTGAELSSRDSVFLAGLAARADEHRAALQACYRWADEVINGSSTQQP